MSDTHCPTCGLDRTPGEAHPLRICRLICAARNLIHNIGGPGLEGWDELAQAVEGLALPGPGGREAR